MLERQLAEIRLKGWAYENGEITDQIECFAVPIYAHKNPLGAISVCVPSFRITEEKKELICSTLKESRARIETYLNANDIDLETLTI